MLMYNQPCEQKRSKCRQCDQGVFNLRIVFSVVFLTLIMLFYFSNPKSKINQWCTFAGCLFWVGIAKQAVMFEIIPMLHGVFNTAGLDAHFAPVFSICTWVIYSLAMPTMAIAALHFGDLYLENPKRMRMIKCVMYVPAMIILFFFAPLQFTEYQLNSRPFWITYAIYNFGFAFALTFFVLRNIYLDDSVSSKKQKKMVAIVLLPPLYYWLITIFVVRLFQLKHLFELWQANLFLVLICISIFIFLAFQDGFMGLKLVKQNYDWNTNIKLLNLSTAYARHFIKNQTPKMEMCID